MQLCMPMFSLLLLVVSIPVSVTGSGHPCVSWLLQEYNSRCNSQRSNSQECSVFSRAVSSYQPGATSWEACLGFIQGITKNVLQERNAASPYVKAKCVMDPRSGNPSQQIQGTVTLTQKRGGGPTRIKIDLEGFNVGDDSIKHGFHIHEEGKLGNMCADAKGHYNPENKQHGSSYDAERHIGDLGNVWEDYWGLVKVTLVDYKINLVGKDTVIGRSIVVHADADDLGRGGFPDSKTTGHAGARLGCCIIEQANPWD